MAREKPNKPEETYLQKLVSKTLFLLFGLLVASTYCFGQESESGKIKVTPFILTDSEGNSFSSEVLKCKIVVLDFWATWCAPCLRSIPELKKVEAKFTNDKNVVFLFVNALESKNRDLDFIKDFLDKREIELYFLLDTKNANSSATTLTDNLNITGLPTTIIMDPAGYVAFRSSGFTGNSEDIMEKLTPIIEELKLK